MHVHQFCSVLTPAASAGIATFTLQTFGTAANVLLTFTASANAGDNELTLATNICTVANLLLVNASAQYSGIPMVTSQLPNSTFRVNVTDHVNAFFSEAQFTLTLVTNTTGAIILINTLPSLATVAQIRNFAPIAGTVLEDISGLALTDMQIAFLIGNLSSQICTLLNNKIVITTFVYMGTGNYQTGLRLRAGLPVWDFDQVVVKRFSSLMIFQFFAGDSYRYVWNLDQYGGWLRYIPSQNCYNNYEPTALNNEIRVSYIAGNVHIPTPFIYNLTRLIGNSLDNNEGIKTLKTGTFEVGYDTKYDLLTEVINDLSGKYNLSRELS